MHVYPVSSAYLAKVQQDNRIFSARVMIQPVNGSSFWIYDEIMLENSLKLSEQVVPGDAIAFGGTVAASLSVGFYNPDGQYDGIQFNGAQVNPSVGLKLDNGTTEWVPLGVFLVDSAKHAIPFQRSPVNTIILTAMDRLIVLEEPFSLVNVLFPINAGALLSAVCAFCGLSRAASATSFLNSNYVIQNAPGNEMSCRDVVGYIAELAGCFARANRAGSLEFVWFKNPATGTPDTTLQPLGRIDFSIEDAPIAISGVSYETADGTIRVGDPNGKYDLALSDNPLIAANPEPILQSVYSAVQGFSYLPCTTTRHDDPALQAGDMVSHPDVGGATYKSIITSHGYAYRGKCKLSASGLSPLVAGWRSKLQKQVSTLQWSVNHAGEDQLDAFADAVGLAFGMLAGVTGGYRINGNDLNDPQFEGKTFLADSPDLFQAQDIWQYSLGGIGHYTNGINSPPQSAWTSDGRLVMPIVNASQVFTGSLMSNNGQSFFDLVNNLLQTNNIRITGGDIRIGTGDRQTIIDDNGMVANYVQARGPLVWQNWLMQETQAGDLAIYAL